MVATLLKLRYRILANNLARRPWQLVGFCFGVLGGLWALGLVVAGLVTVAVVSSREDVGILIVLAGSVLLLGWFLGPLLIAGADATVDATRLAPFPLSRGQLMRALAAVSATGIPGFVTAFAILASLTVWARWPAAYVVAVPGVLLAFLTCVVATQLASTLSQGGGSRRGRELSGTILLVAVMLSGPIIAGVAALIGRAQGGGGLRLDVIADAVGWTPLGAAWAAPAAVAGGSWIGGFARLAVAAATVVVLVWLWERALSRLSTSPSQRTARVVRQGAVGLFGLLPTGGMGATWARSLRAWMRDPRYLRQLLVIPVFPVVFGVTGGTDSWLFVMSPVWVALVMAISGYTDISYDGTAFASVLATGIPGRQDRLGRLLGSACVGVPLLLIVTVTVSLLADDGRQFLPSFGAAFGLLLAGYAVSAVSSVLIVSPVAAAGDSPFRSVPGQTFLYSMLVFVVWAACFVVASPSLILAAIAAALSSPVWGWAAVVTAFVVGIAAIVGGVILGGRTLDRTGPDLLARIRAFPT